MTRLSVNVNKVATLRNSRGKNNPDVLKTALDIVSYGAQGITVHPRPDGRHIRREDVRALKPKVKVELNIEGYPDGSFLGLIDEIKPEQCTLVPDAPGVLTSNAGWEVEKNFAFLQSVVDKLHESGVRTSLFIDPQKLSATDIKALKALGTERVELYTEAYADSFGTSEEARIFEIYKRAAGELNAAGIDLNAGHDLNLDNLPTFIKGIPSIKEVSIGHALICDALYLGLEETVKRYLECLS